MGKRLRVLFRVLDKDIWVFLCCSFFLRMVGITRKSRPNFAGELMYSVRCSFLLRCGRLLGKPRKTEMTPV